MSEPNPPRSRKRLAVLALTVAVAGGGVLTGTTVAAGTVQPAVPELVPHRAVYDLELRDRPGGSTFAQVGGRMVYQLDMTCDSIVYSHRMLMNLVTQEGVPLQSETTVNFLESRNGGDMRFSVRESYNGQVTTVREGKVTRSAPDRPGAVEMSRDDSDGDPVPTEVPPGVMFPLAHSLDLMRAASAGKSFHHAVTFDGESLSSVDSLIRPDQTAKNGGKREAVIPKAMQDMPAWRMRLAFFDPTEPDPSPYYETSMRLFANGLSGDFTMETEELSALARLTRVEFYDAPDCN